MYPSPPSLREEKEWRKERKKESCTHYSSIHSVVSRNQVKGNERDVSIPKWQNGWLGPFLLGGESPGWQRFLLLGFNKNDLKEKKWLENFCFKTEDKLPFSVYFTFDFRGSEGVQESINRGRFQKSNVTMKILQYFEMEGTYCTVQFAQRMFHSETFTAAHYLTKSMFKITLLSKVSLLLVWLIFFSFIYCFCVPRKLRASDRW